MTKIDLAQRADLALGDLTGEAGFLLPAQSDTFFRRIIDAPTILGAVRTMQMNSPTARINKVGFGQRVLRAAPQGSAPYVDDTNNSDRYLAAAKRVRPQLSLIEMATKEVMAELHLPYEVLEDNIEREGFADTLLVLLAERAALDLEELLLLGDTGSADEYLALHDGIIKRVQSNVVDFAGARPDLPLWNDMKKSLPTRYRRVLPNLRYWVHPDVESDYRVKFASRQTGGGDNAATGMQPIMVLGSPMTMASTMPLTTAIYGNPQNVIFGIQRQVRLERDRDIRGRQLVFVMTARVAIQIEEEEAMVKGINLGEG